MVLEKTISISRKILIKSTTKNNFYCNSILIMKKHASGAEKRKRKSNIQANISKLPKISDFFGNDCEDSSSQEIDQQNPEEVQDVILPYIKKYSGHVR